MIEGSWLGRRSGRAQALRGARRWRPSRRMLIVLAAVLATLLGGWLWLRDSSLVAVKRVTVAGASGPDAVRIRAALRTAALNMTTLDVRMDTLNTVVQPFPVVKGLQVSTQFPHGLRIRVIEQVPVGAIAFDGRRIAVAGDGTLLHDVPASASLPVISVRVAPGGSRVSDRGTTHAVALLAAAPYELLGHITQVTTTAAHGLMAQLRSGPSIYFGDAARLREKWAAAAAVLADGGSAGAVYIDVTDPTRPAAGSSSGSSSGVGSTSAGAPSASTSNAASSGAPPAPAAPSSASTTTTPSGVSAATSGG